ncbi:MAG: GYD domain-containing protein [Ilumatobacteraceae bacterium]
MPKYVMLSTIGPEGFRTLSENPERLRAVNEEIEALGVHVIEQFALLGQYDFLNIVEAEDDATVAKLATRLAARGTLKTTTVRAIEVDDYIAALASE